MDYEKLYVEETGKKQPGEMYFEEKPVAWFVWYEGYADWLCRRLEKVEERKIELSEKLNNGRDYLMQINPKDLTVEDALESFGFGKNGLKSF